MDYLATRVCEATVPSPTADLSPTDSSQLTAANVLLPTDYPTVGIFHRRKVAMCPISAIFLRAAGVVDVDVDATVFRAGYTTEVVAGL